jgi:uncharacterized protein (DUF4415 family)
MTMKSASSLSAKPRDRKRESTSRTSKTDLERLRSGKPGVPTGEHPEANVNHIIDGIVREGLRPQPGKAAISIRVDQDVLDWFKSRGRGYQTRINSVLRAFRDASL